MPNVNDLLRTGLGLARGTADQAGRLAGRAVSQASDRAQQLRHARPAPKDLDDATIRDKVESIVFRRKGVKEAVNINVVDGIVELRGEVRNAAQVRALEAAVRAIPEVKGVENLLHLPKTPARTKPPAKTPRRTRGKVTDDRTTDLVPDAEQTGKQAAKEHRGRQPAPMGSQGEGGEESSSGSPEGARESAPPRAAAQTTGLHTGTETSPPD